jgi:hypothetical protein
LPFLNVRLIPFPFLFTTNMCHYAPYMLFSTQQNSIKRAMQVDSKACIYHQYEIEKVVLNLHC